MTIRSKLDKICFLPFRAELVSILAFDLNYIDNDTFTQIIMELLDKHCPIKLRYVRGNESPFMAKELRKAIMKRSKLRNKVNKLRTLEAMNDYRKQRNFCTSLLRQTKRSYFEKLSPSSISDNKKFWKLVKPLFSDKMACNPNKLKLLEGGEIHDQDAEVAEDFGKYFSSIVENLEIPRPLDSSNSYSLS